MSNLPSSMLGNNSFQCFIEIFTFFVTATFTFYPSTSAGAGFTTVLVVPARFAAFASCATSACTSATAPEDLANCTYTSLK